MAQATDAIGILLQALKDAGCDEETVSSCMDLAKRGRWRNIPPLLASERKRLLDAVHANQRRIDCLDFLVYQIGKEHV